MQICFAHAHLFCMLQKNPIIKAKYPPCRVKRGLKTLAYPQGRYPLCSFVQPTFASHRDRATGGHSRGQGKRPAFPLQKPDPYFQLWVLYTRYHAQGRQCHCFFRILFIFAQAFHCPHRRLCRYRRHLLYPMHGLHRNPWS